MDGGQELTLAFSTFDEKSNLLEKQSLYKKYENHKNNLAEKWKFTKVHNTCLYFSIYIQRSTYYNLFHL